MSTSKIAAFSFAAVLLSAVSVQAATHKRSTHHMTHAHKMHSMHSSRHQSTAMRGSMRGNGGMANADHSADALNAQSLTRSQGAQ